MKITKLGIEWGAAFQEAQPHRIIPSFEEAATIEFFENSCGEVCIEFAADFKVTVLKDGRIQIAVQHS